MTSHVRAFVGLTILLWVLAALIVVAGLLVIFATAWFLGLVQSSEWFGASPLVPLLFKFLGVLALGLGYLVSCAARDPVRYVAVIDVMAFFAIVGAIIDAIAALNHVYGPLFPAGALWARAIVRLIIAVLLIAWRPRQTA